MNFVTNLFFSKNWNGVIYDSIFVVINRFFKMIHYISCSKTISTKDLIEIFIREMIKLYNVSFLVISDRDSIFISKFWLTLCYCLNIIKNLSTTFHSQIDNQTEHQNNIIKQYLRAYVNFEQNNWITLFFIAKFAYNNSKNASIDFSLFEVMIDYFSRITFEKPFDSRVKSIFVKTHAKHLNNLIKMCKKVLLTTQKHQKTFVDKHSKFIQFAIKDYVWLRGKNIKTKRNRKLKWKTFEFFEILKKHNNQIYKLNLFKRWRIHNVFHVSLLKSFKKKKKTLFS